MKKIGSCQFVGRLLTSKATKMAQWLFLFMLCGLMTVSASSFPQKRVTLHLNNVPLPEALEALQLQSNPVKILYSERSFTTRTKVNVSSTNQPFGQVLDDMLSGTGLYYKMIDSNLVAIVPIPVTAYYRQDVSGVVTDASGHPLGNATVMEKGSTNATVTDATGHFQLHIKDDNTFLVISLIGFETKELAVKGQQPLTVILNEKVSGLNEVVVVGYGTQKKKDLTGAITVLSSKSLEDRPNIQFGDAIEGKAAGVQVMKSSGQPQAGFSMRIRGTSSITSGSEPLYIVDGVPTASISEINPADIASFSVLKDAASAAIYGASGANGVVLITTKRGGNGETQVNLDTYFGFSAVRKKLPVLNSKQYAALMGDLGESLNTNVYTANTNWQDELFRHGMSQNYNLSVKGGNARTAFYLSGGLVKQDGIVINNTMNRTNFKANLDHTVSKVFKVGTSLSYNRWYDVDVTEGSRNSVMMNTLLGAPVIGVWDSTGKQFTVDPFRQDLDNPVGLATGNKHNWVNNRFLGNVYVEANITSRLKARTMFGYENYHGQYNSFVDPYQTTEGRGKKGMASLSDNDNTYWISENTLTYQQQFRKSNLSVLAGFIATKTTAGASSINTRNFANATITTVNGGSIIDGATASVTQTATASYISRATYNYDERYILSANFRSDASTVFGPERRWGYFPAFSAAWRISQEHFFQDVKIINDLKLRASWGSVGNSQIPAYSYLGSVAPSGTYVIGDAVLPGYTPTTLDNPILKWEATRQTDIGLDASLWDSRLEVTMDYYDKKTSGLLLQTPVPASSGYTTALKNTGSLKNSGFEFSVTSHNIVSKRFEWTTDANISLNRNKVLDIKDGTIYDGAIDSRGNTSIVQAGLPLGSFYGYVAQGVDPQTGNMIYRMADKEAGLQTSDMAVIGNANPKYMFGMTNNLKLGQWFLNIFFQGVQGNDILNATRLYTEAMWEPRNQSAAVLRRWTTPGQHTDIPRPDYNNPDAPQPNYNSLISSRFVENGSYVRLKSLSLGYNFSGYQLRTSKVRNIKLYATAENLLTFTHYKGFDPEVNAYGNSNTALGIDFGSYPQTRNFIVGLNVTF